MWPYGVPIQPACDSRGQLEFVNFHPPMPTSNAQLPTSNVEMVIALPGSSRPVGGDFVLTRSRGCRFVDRADHCSDDNHLNEAADASVKNQSSRNGLDGIKPKAHPDRRNFQQNTEPNSCEYPTACEPTRVNHHERKNNESLSDNDPVKQTSHFILRPPKIWRFGIKVFEQNAVQQPTPDEQENVCGDKREDKAFHN